MIEEYLIQKKRVVDFYLEGLLSEKKDIPDVLKEAMEYSLLAGGKRLRPILAMASMEALGFDSDKGLTVASSLELIHTYSLIHDDLPAMDNDDFRRGKPSNHKFFGEAVAILAGDALLTYAFEMISSPTLNSFIKPERLLLVTHELAGAAGMCGMVGGQILDMCGYGGSVKLDNVWDMQRRKTAALIRGAVRMGGILGNATASQMKSLTAFGSLIGVVFQISDDILDLEGDPAIVGKPLRRDSDRGKNTFPSVVGIEESKKIKQTLYNEAVEALDSFGEKGMILEGIADYIVERKN